MFLLLLELEVILIICLASSQILNFNLVWELLYLALPLQMFLLCTTWCVSLFSSFSQKMAHSTVTNNCQMCTKLQCNAMQLIMVGLNLKFNVVSLEVLLSLLVSQILRISYLLSKMIPKDFSIVSVILVYVVVYAQYIVVGFSVLVKMALLML